jgi:hypothetical protein
MRGIVAQLKGGGRGEGQTNTRNKWVSEEQEEDQGSKPTSTPTHKRVQVDQETQETGRQTMTAP